MDIRDSLEFILAEPAPRFSQRFYANFFRHHPEIERLFDGVDLQQQAVKLTMALNAIVQHYLRPYPAMKNDLRLLGHRHYQFGVELESYPAFEVSLLATLGDFHGQHWNQDLSDAWSTAYQQAVALMKEGHRDDFEAV